MKLGIVVSGRSCLDDDFGDFFRLLFLFFGSFLPFLAVFSHQGPPNRPPDTFFHRSGPIFIEIRWIWPILVIFRPTPKYFFWFFCGFWPFLAVFSPQDLKNRPPDPFVHRSGPIFIQIRWLWPILVIFRPKNHPSHLRVIGWSRMISFLSMI